MDIEERINIVKRGFEESFKEEQLYNRQAKDEKHLDLILNLIKLNKNEVVLDLGTGSGYLAFAIAKQNPSNKVIGLDIVEATLKRNSEKAEQQNLSNLKFIAYDGVKFPFEDGSIDVIYSRYALHHFPDIHYAFSELKRVLKPKGRIVLSDPTPNDNDKLGFVDAFMKKKPDGHVKFYTKREFEELAKENKFKIILNVMSEIRFPRQGVDGYKELLNEYDKEIVDGYDIQIIKDQIYITEKVLNMVIQKGSW